MCTLLKLPSSKNEKLLKLEQYRAMDAGIGIGVTLENNIPPSIDTSNRAREFGINEAVR